jgi:hypothetical protein
MSSSGCVNPPNCFFISVASLWLKNINETLRASIRKVYYACFGVKLEDQDNSWAPHKECYVCVEDLRKWSKGKNKAFRFGVPIKWRWLLLLFLWLCSPARAMASSFTRVLDHTQRRATVGRTPLDEWSARRRDLYLTTHNKHNRQISMPPVGFESTISVGEPP